MEQMEQLKLLMNYTIFHIGIYLTLSGLMVSLLGVDAFKKRTEAMVPYLVVALICFMVAGIFGGLIASNIPYFERFADFTQAWIGPWFATKLLPASFCMTIEHSAFWLGLIVFLFGFWRTGRQL